jgi:hypothetical protein
MFSTQRGCWSVGSERTSPLIIPTPVWLSNDCALCSRWPADAATSPPSYIHVSGSYVRSAGSKPLK